MKTLYSNTATALNTTMREIHVSPFEKLKALYTVEIFFFLIVVNPLHLNDSGNEKWPYG